MKEQELLYALNDIRTEYIEESAPVRRRPLRLLMTAAVAASLALMLIGAGVLYGESIQSWMAQRWGRENGGSMSDGQIALVDSMSQEIGLSQTVGDITVDVDSALFGDRDFEILVRVRGQQFDQKRGLGFRSQQMELEPDPAPLSGEDVSYSRGRGWRHAGFDGDGSLLLLFKCYWDAPMRPDEAFQVRLTLSDLCYSGSGGEVTEVIQEGTWEFEFPLEVTGVPEAVVLSGCTVGVKDPENGEQVDVELKNLTLYSTGLSYEKTDPDAPDVGLEITVVLKNGGSIQSTLGIDNTCWWDVPVDPAEVKEIQIGQTTIPVHAD